MAIVNHEVEFGYKNGAVKETFTGIRELGFNKHGSFSICGFTSPKVPEGEPRGTYSSYVPISNYEYRLKYPTKAAYKLHKDQLEVHDDWGNVYYIYAPYDILRILAGECGEEGLRDLNDDPRGDPFGPYWTT